MLHTTFFAISLIVIAHGALLGVLLEEACRDIRTRLVSDRAVAVALLVWVGALLILGYTAPWHLEKPNSLPLVQAACGLVPQGAGEGLFGGCVLAGFAILCGTLAGCTTGGPAIGGGDVKLLFVIGLYLGVERGMYVLLVACLVALGGWTLAGMAAWFAHSRPSPEARGSRARGRSNARGRIARSRSVCGRSMRSRPRQTRSHTFPFVPALAVATALVQTVVLVS